MAFTSLIRFMAMPTVLISSMFLSACGWFGSSEDDYSVQAMSVETEFHSLHLCSKVSPAIKVANVPAGVVSYDVRVSYVSNGMQSLLGGGSWISDGIGSDGGDLIPEGALVGRYRGPCPGEGTAGEVEVRVSAMPAGGGTPLATAVCTVVVD